MTTIYSETRDDFLGFSDWATLENTKVFISGYLDSTTPTPFKILASGGEAVLIKESLYRSLASHSRPTLDTTHHVTVPRMFSTSGPERFRIEFIALVVPDDQLEADMVIGGVQLGQFATPAKEGGELRLCFEKDRSRIV